MRIIGKTEIKEIKQDKTPLKPCPFCGGKVKMRDAINDKVLGSYFIFSCDNCEANLNFVNKSENKLTAIEAWNRRVNDNE